MRNVKSTEASQPVLDQGSLSLFWWELVIKLNVSERKGYAFWSLIQANNTEL